MTWHEWRPFQCHPAVNKSSKMAKQVASSPVGWHYAKLASYRLLPLVLPKLTLFLFQKERHSTSRLCIFAQLSVGLVSWGNLGSLCQSGANLCKSPQNHARYDLDTNLPIHFVYTPGERWFFCMPRICPCGPATSLSDKDKGDICQCHHWVCCLALFRLPFWKVQGTHGFVSWLLNHFCLILQPDLIQHVARDLQPWQPGLGYHSNAVHVIQLLNRTNQKQFRKPQCQRNSADPATYLLPSATVSGLSRFFTSHLQFVCSLLGFSLFVSFHVGLIAYLQTT